MANKNNSNKNNSGSSNNSKDKSKETIKLFSLPTILYKPFENLFSTRC